MIELPLTVHGMVVPNNDGTFDIYINGLLSPERMEEALAHELEHIREDHMYRIECSVAQLESEADKASTILPEQETQKSKAFSCSVPHLPPSFPTTQLA